MPKIINKRYRKFLDEGFIDLLSEKELSKALDNIKGRNVNEGRALVICLYYTGARPAEALELKSRDIQKKGNYIIVQMKGLKGGLARPIYLPYNKELVKEFYIFCTTIFNEAFLFYNYKGYYPREIEYKNREGELITKKYVQTTDKLRYYFEKWFNGDISPYFLRHNRFSQLMLAGASIDDIRIFKGAKSLSSVIPYSHLSTKTATKLAKLLE